MKLLSVGCYQCQDGHKNDCGIIDTASMQYKKKFYLVGHVLNNRFYSSHKTSKILLLKRLLAATCTKVPLAAARTCWELTTLPRPPSWILGSLCGREGKRERGGEGKEGKGHGLTAYRRSFFTHFKHLSKLSCVNFFFLFFFVSFSFSVPC